MLFEAGRGRNVWKNDHRSRGVEWYLINRNSKAFLAVFLLILSVFFSNAGAEEYLPDVSGISLNLGYTYDPSENIWFSQVSFFKLYDYDKVWPHRAPEDLRFKVEASLGGARDNSDIRCIASVNIFALYYLSALETNRLKPYVEAGIGSIYTDYRGADQDYRFNFNPQAGMGMDIKMGDEPPYFMAVRGHHLSNAGIGSSNRGQNSVVCLFGRYF